MNSIDDILNADDSDEEFTIETGCIDLEGLLHSKDDLEEAEISFKIPETKKFENTKKIFNKPTDQLGDGKQRVADSLDSTKSERGPESDESIGADDIILSNDFGEDDDDESNNISLQKTDDDALANADTRERMFLKSFYEITDSPHHYLAKSFIYSHGLTSYF